MRFGLVAGALTTLLLLFGVLTMGRPPLPLLRLWRYSDLKRSPGQQASLTSSRVNSEYPLRSSRPIR